MVTKIIVSGIFCKNVNQDGSLWQHSVQLDCHCMSDLAAGKQRHVLGHLGCHSAGYVKSLGVPVLLGWVRASVRR